MSNKGSVLPKNFFLDNPIKEVSAAHLTYFQIQTIMMSGLHEEIEETVLASMDEDRYKLYEQEKQNIQEIDSAEDVIKYMRKIKEPYNRQWLIEKALDMQEEVVPLILKRILTSGHDVFIENAATILANADIRYVETLGDIFLDIRNKYARSEMSLVFGVKRRDEYAPLLLEQYKQMKDSKGDDDYEQGPLLALYLIYET